MLTKKAEHRVIQQFCLQILEGYWNLQNCLKFLSVQIKTKTDAVESKTSYLPTLTRIQRLDTLSPCATALLKLPFSLILLNTG